MADDQTIADDVVVPLRPEARLKDPTNAERQARFRKNHERNGRGKKARRNNKKRGDRTPTVTHDPVPTVTPVPALSGARQIAPTVTPVSRETPPARTVERAPH
jgi:hypothetical protein